MEALGTGGGVALASALARVGIAVAVAPFFGSRHASWPVRLGIGAAFALAAVPAAAASLAALPLPAGGATTVAFLVKEGVIGVVLGVLSALLFDVAAGSGRWLDAVGGLLPADTPDETRGPLTRFHLLLSLVVFVSAGGHRLVLAVLVGSYAVLPVGLAPSLAALGGAAGIVIHVGAVALALALALALPAVGAALILELAFGLAHRAAPSLAGAGLAVAARPLVVTLSAAALAMSMGLVLAPLVDEVLGSVHGVIRVLAL